MVEAWSNGFGRDGSLCMISAGVQGVLTTAAAAAAVTTITTTTIIYF